MNNVEFSSILSYLNNKMNKIVINVYENIYERKDGKGLESYQTVKVNGKWIVGDKVSDVNKIPIAAQFKGNWDSIAALLKTVTGKEVEVEYSKW